MGKPTNDQPFEKETALIRVGTAGWSYEDWNGIVYPRSRPSGFDPLAFQASLFDTNEINSTFYRTPTARTTRDWARRIAHNPRFAFTAKLSSAFTHARDAGPAEKAEFLRAMEPLQQDGRLGAILVQFPVSFRNSPENGAHLEKILDELGGLPLAVEFRHSSWDAPEVLRLLEDQGAAFVNIDQPRLGDNLPATNHVTSSVAYYRFHGRNAEKWFGPDTSNEERYNYLYSEAELAPWVERIRETRQRTPESNVYAILNNHFRGQAVANAAQLQHLVTGETASLPETLRNAYPALASVSKAAAESAQRTLF